MPPGRSSPAVLQSHRPHGDMPTVKLELAWSPVEALVAGSPTALSGSRLTVDLDELQPLLAAEPRLARVQLDLVRPGESCRIGRVLDVIAPRARVGGGD